jgi:hypothetical protein
MRSPTISQLTRRSAVALLALGVSLPAAAGAQQVNASAAAYGLGGNFTARARGAHAVAWNPANLGLAGNPGFSFQLLSLSSTSGLNPIDLGHLKEFEGKVIPAATREEWVQLATEQGGETGSGDLGFGIFAFSAGPLALQVSTTAYGSASLAPDAVEAIFFGNAGRTGVVKSFNFAGSSLKAGAFSSAALSYGLGLGDRSGSSGGMSIGVTGKYIIGHGLGIARDNGSTTTPDVVTVNLPMVYVSDTAAKTLSGGGTGIGVDVGFAWQSAGTTFGVTVQNVVNTFAWDESKLVFRSGQARFDEPTGSTTSFEEEPFANAPASLKNEITNNKFKPIIAAGLSRDVTSMITVTADARQQLTDDLSIQFGPKTQVGGGVELRLIPLVPIRAGATYVTGGFGVSGGVGVRVLGFEIAAAGMLRKRDDKNETGAMVSIVNIR